MGLLVGLNKRMEKTISSIVSAWHGHERHTTSGNGKTASGRGSCINEALKPTGPERGWGQLLGGRGTLVRGQEAYLPSHPGSATNSLCDPKFTASPLWAILDTQT